MIGVYPKLFRARDSTMGFQHWDERRVQEQVRDQPFIIATVYALQTALPCGCLSSTHRLMVLRSGVRGRQTTSSVSA